MEWLHGIDNEKSAHSAVTRIDRWTNNQLTCSTIDGTKVAYLCSSIECPNKCVRWSRRRYHDQNEAHQQAPTGTERWVTQVSKGRRME